MLNAILVFLDQSNFFFVYNPFWCIDKFCLLLKKKISHFQKRFWDIYLKWGSCTFILHNPKVFRMYRTSVSLYLQLNGTSSQREQNGKAYKSLKSVSMKVTGTTLKLLFWFPETAHSPTNSQNAHEKLRTHQTY